MDGVHDLGGMDGFGPVEPEPSEPVFHHRWEGRVFAISTTMTASGVWNIDIGRFGIERLSPAVYLSSSYYEKWRRRVELLVVEHDLATQDEIDSGHSNNPGKHLPNSTFTADRINSVLKRGTFTRAPQAPPRFQAGDRVRARNIHPHSHTRLPRYVRGHLAVVERVHDPNVFPDSVVRGEGESPQWLYTILFDGHDLWGDDAEPGTSVSVDAFEPYLEPA
jgi:nitrile hydratase beta subunit